MISFQNVSMVYPNGTAALNNVTLNIKDGEFVFIIGKSGAGKTTLTKLLLCEEKDLLLSEYCIVRCTAAELNALPKEAIKGRKENPYGVTAIVRRDAAPAGANTSPISIEELFVFMVKEA